MPVFIEPTEQLNRCINQLSDSEAARVWHEVEHLNNRLSALLRPDGEHDNSPDGVAERTAIELVCKHHKIARGLLFSPLKYQKLVQARCHLIALLREELHYVHQRIALLLRRDRTTISHALHVHADLAATDVQYRTDYQLLRQTLRAACRNLAEAQPVPVAIPVPVRAAG
jgi:chromosomal replication initiation ATPase DnaA